MNKRKRKTDTAGTGHRYWIYGRHAVYAALRNPARVKHRLMATQNAVADLDAEALNTLPVETVPQPKALARSLPPDAVHQGVALEVSPLAPPALEDLLGPPLPQGVFVLLDQVTDPHNVGAVLRSAAAFGAQAVITTTRRGTGENGALAKAASGALDLVPYLAVTNLSRALETLKTHGVWTLGLDGGAATGLSDALPPGPTALVLGAEGAGLRRLTRRHCDVLARLPLNDAMPSLNVSNAAAVALYAATLQRSADQS